ncbi:hypothetical protein AAEU31_16640 [Pseudoalteromonas sp. SSMSWG5]|jgi:hypothetical protein|uniref:hypothetical protein n=1 Tax=unclassified Pseudoalteromonas TaxID=194690 RepID=UPI000C510D3F|nr:MULTISPECIES: hypothetical protein [unclassified Pseudoalteromonas]MBD58054.1 hypothetical protein [Pseudoalteromonas sp.]MCF2899647.1 hypothetical protein [Pseudoalteromonas sp. OFAV1]MCO7248804.1 hypothetical protein [Pseudoalteromonas sp. Ps84H-4]TGV18589.1 hypothetical protein E5N72_00235 [Pseudoalteromonas sp. MEBiC 03607]TMO46075.1 hypothetical protein CWC25_04810 [Pseudoalteromonas sp. S4389]|tara:strand:- start:91 stop:282 length:192 start_codon:yes stop_codon:yes gene_type:complete
MSNSILKMMPLLAVAALVITAPNTLLNNQGAQKLDQQLETSIAASIEQMNNKIDHQIEQQLNN